MRVILLLSLVLSHAVAQTIVTNSWLCDWIGIEGATSSLKEKYRTLISNLNKDKTLKAQQTRVANWITTNAADLPELQKRTIMTAHNKVMIPHMTIPKSILSLNATKLPKAVDKQVIENTIYNAKFWLSMRARDVKWVNDILDKMESQVSEEKLDEVRSLIWSEDKRFHNFFRPHYDVIKQLVLARITSTSRRYDILDLMEDAEEDDDDIELDQALVPLMEPMAAEFFTGCGV